MRLKRIILEALYTDRRNTFRMLRLLGKSRRTALTEVLFGHDRQKTLLRESALRLMLYRDFRDRTDIFSECYFGKSFLEDTPQLYVDVGAHKGDWSRACCLLKPPRKLVMLEANPDLIPILNTLALSMPKTEARVIHAAAGSNSGQIEFRCYESPLMNSVLPLNKREADLLPNYDVAFQKQLSVRQVTLDEALAGEGKIDLLKIDTQGYDLQVLKGP